MWLSTINYKIIPCKKKYGILLRFGTDWCFLRWRRTKNHHEGEYCLFDNEQDAKLFAIDWIKDGYIRKWIDYDL